ncbi:MAG: GNAT family N-acetyltransferase [Candidatus Hodarchaeales archaeon]
MVKDRLHPPFGISNKKKEQEFFRIFNEEPLSHTCYLHWYLAQTPKLVTYNFTLNPLDYIFHYENKYHLSSVNIWPLMKKIRWFKTNSVLIFNDSSMWPSIQERFENFRSLETNEETNTFNTYITFQLSTETFNPGWSDLNSVIRFPNDRIKIPKRYRHLEGGIAYGYLKGNEIVSFAAAPHILQSKTHSFAIIRGIETKILERKQGYSHKTLTKLCQEILIDNLITRIYLWVENSNEVAIKLYKKLGFVEDSKIYATYCDRKSG